MDLQITLADFESAWNTSTSAWFRNRFIQRELNYTELNNSERDDVILHILNILEGELSVAGPHRNKDWELGWNENYQNYTLNKDSTAIIPKYFDKHQIVRWKQNWIKSSSSSLEYDMFSTLIDWVIDTNLVGFESIYEFGCGTGHNLIRMRERFPETNLVGLDWATSSQSLINEFAAKTSDIKLKSANFDFINPNYDLEIQTNSAVITIAALEQTGENFKEFISYLISNKVGLVLHIEPINELLDENKLIDNLSIRYFRKRNYLNGLLSHLKELQEVGKIKITNTQRSFVGSMYIDGYSIIAWKPLN
jgi:hypothetical protein